MSEIDWSKAPVGANSQGAIDGIDCIYWLSDTGYKIGGNDKWFEYGKIIPCGANYDIDDFSLISFKSTTTPIDIRTNEEKAIDDIRKIDQSIHENINFEQDFLNEIKAGKIHNVTWGK